MLDKQKRVFRIRKDYQGYWLMPEFQGLVQDRIEFALARYFYRKERGSSVSASMRGFAVEVAYSSRRDKGFTKEVRNVFRKPWMMPLWIAAKNRRVDCTVTKM